jgi:hypothetical protein
MDKKFLYITLFMLLLAFPLVSAKNPIQISSVGAGLEIQFPAEDYLEANITHDFNFHIFNSSTGLAVNSTAITVTCFFHLYNETGNHLLKLIDTVPSNTFDYEFEVGGGNWTFLGEYSYIVQCNTSTQGGFAAVPITITSSGLEQNISRTQTITRSIYFLFIISIILFLAFLFVPSKPTVKWTYFLISIMFLLQSVNILYVGMLDEVINPRIEQFFSFLATSSFILFWFAMGLLIVMWILSTLQTILFNKKQKQQEKYE